MTFYMVLGGSPPDGLGRQAFALLWIEPDGIFHHEPHRIDRQPVGHRRAQHFWARPGEYRALLEANGHTVTETTNDDAERRCQTGPLPSERSDES